MGTYLNHSDPSGYFKLTDKDVRKKRIKKYSGLLKEIFYYQKNIISKIWIVLQSWPTDQPS